MDVVLAAEAKHNHHLFSGEKSTGGVVGVGEDQHLHLATIIHGVLISLLENFFSDDITT